MTLEESKIEIQDIIDIYEKEDMYPLLNDRQISALKVAISALQAQEAKTQLSAEGTTSDLISRQAAINALVKAIRKDPYYDSNEAINGLGVCDVRVILNDLPSAEPEIIHCRECQHHRRDNTGCYYCVRKEYGYGWGLNDFCSDAERRTDGSD